MLCLGSDRHQRPELCLFLKTIRGLYILIKFGFISLTVHSHTLSRKCFFFFFFCWSFSWALESLLLF